LCDALVRLRLVVDLGGVVDGQCRCVHLHVRVRKGVCYALVLRDWAAEDDSILGVLLGFLELGKLVVIRYCLTAEGAP
jgi:hypothetical protein